MYSLLVSISLRCQNIIASVLHVDHGIIVISCWFFLELEYKTMNINFLIPTYKKSNEKFLFNLTWLDLNLKTLQE